LGFLDKFKKPKEEQGSAFSPYTNTLNEKGVKIVLDYLRNELEGIDYVMGGDFGAYSQLLPKYRTIPDNIELEVHGKSDELVRQWCKQLGQLLTDGGIDVQLRDNGDSLQIETQNLESKEWLPAVIMYGVKPES